MCIRDRLVRAKAFIPLISPVITSSLINTRERAIALEVRGFDEMCIRDRQSTQEVSGNNKLVKALELSGFKDKYDSLQEKGNSKLVREVNDDAVSFSGGEMQKLLFARALYKESDVYKRQP